MGFTVPDYMLKECQGCKSKQTIITSVHLLWTWLELLESSLSRCSFGHSRKHPEANTKQSAF